MEWRGTATLGKKTRFRRPRSAPEGALAGRGRAGGDFFAWEGVAC